MSRPTFPLLLCAAALVPAAGYAQYRGGGPAVITPPPPAPDPAVLAAQGFAAAYARARSPRFMVFWNRTFDDEVSSEYRQHHSEHEVQSHDSHALEQETAGPAGNAKRNEQGDLSERRFDSLSGTERVRPPERSHIGSEALNWQLEDVFSQTLHRAGAVLVDRRASIRLTGAQQGAGEHANMQEIEMRAAAGYADIVLEVLQTPDSRSPANVSFQVTATDLRNARVIARIATAAQPRPPRMGFVAGAGGGLVRAAAPEPGPAQVAHQLALETLAALADGLGASGR